MMVAAPSPQSLFPSPPPEPTPTTVVPSLASLSLQPISVWRVLFCHGLLLRMRRLSKYSLGKRKKRKNKKKRRKLRKLRK
jgi:hypothetical protein